MAQTAALLFALVCAGVGAFQVALTLGHHRGLLLTPVPDMLRGVLPNPVIQAVKL
jgi:hypothetical protein